MIVQTVITTRDNVEAFVKQKKMDDPAAYIRQLCHLHATWLPVYFFIRQANLSVEEAIQAIAAR